MNLKGGESMETDLKRFTISITPKMEAELGLAKQKCYSHETQSNMIRDLIARGLAESRESSKRKVV